MDRERIRLSSLHDRVMSAEQAASLIQDGMTVGMSGFTRAGDAKAVPLALIARGRAAPVHINLLTGASLGNDLDGMLADAGMLKRRLPFQADARLRAAINRGEVMFIDQHLSEMVEQLRSGALGHLDCAIIEATAITETGAIVPTTSVGNSASFAILADMVIVEINLAQPAALEGLHDIYIPKRRPAREPIGLTRASDRVGTPAVQIDPAKIAAIVVTNQPDSATTLQAADADTTAISRHLITFLEQEVLAGRLPRRLPPLQAGIGAIANAVLAGLKDSPFTDLELYSEVLQDSAFDLFEAGKLAFASASSIVLTAPVMARVMPQIAAYRARIVLRPQEVSNHPEVVRRLGLIAINTAIECDIYGNVNSTHVNGTHMMNGIGGSGDFARNAQLSVFVTKSLAKDGRISSIVPMVTHVDHTEHDVDVIVTERGLADLRGLAPRERARAIMENCLHPSYRDQMADYVRRAGARGGQTPHILEEAFSWHTRAQATGSMLAQPAPAALSA
jgi:succinyl-CoA:acetate CoA-transferase